MSAVRLVALAALLTSCNGSDSQVDTTPPSTSNAAVGSDVAESVIDDLVLDVEGTATSPLCSEASAPSVGLEFPRHCDDPPHEELLTMTAEAFVDVGGAQVAATFLVSAYDITVEAVTQDGRPVKWQQVGAGVLVLSPKTPLAVPIEVRLTGDGVVASCSFGPRVDPCTVDSIDRPGPDT